MLDDKQIISLFRKYEKQTIERFKQVCEDEGYVVYKEFNENGIWDEILCKISDFGFLEELLDDMENGINPIEYGINPK